MKLKEFDILLDIKRNKKVEEFEIVQGDYESNILKISLVEDFNEYDLSGLSVEIAFAKSDGTTVLQDLNNGISLIGNKIVCTLKTNTIASPGKVLAEVRILEGPKLLTSSRFSFFVRQSIVDDKTIESTNEFPVLLELINTTNGLITQVNQIEKQVPEQVIIDLAAVSNLAAQLQVDLTTHKADYANMKFGSRPYTSNANMVYYLDEVNGNDNNNGTTAQTAFKTFGKVMSLIPRVLLHNYTIKIIGNYSSVVNIDSVIMVVGNLLIEGETQNATNHQLIGSITVYNVYQANISYGNIALFKHLTINNSYFSAIIALNSFFNVQNCVFTGTNRDGGVQLINSVSWIVNTSFSGQIGIIAMVGSQCFSNNNSGTCSKYGLQAQQGGVIAKLGTQPTGTTANENTVSGGVIR